MLDPVLEPKILDVWCRSHIRNLKYEFPLHSLSLNREAKPLIQELFVCTYEVQAEHARSP